ncbi:MULTISPECIES: hypothetical protein [unclassified Isoptericola]|uniref:hypothetical protein n=1 Tax=unclassified Isoptericola TaxID=2623355 RepID=UPI00365813B5
MTPEPPLSDDELVARLRQATADVPPSTLDLDAVLRSSRHRAVRHRAVVAVACVAALGAVGFGAPRVPALLDEGGGIGPAAATGTTAWGACVARLVDVRWTSERAEPIVMWVDRLIVSGEVGSPDRRSQLDPKVSFDPRAATPSVDGADVTPAIAAGVLARATEDSRHPPTTKPYFGSPGTGTGWTGLLAGLDESVRGVPAAQVPESPWDPGSPWNASWEDMAADTYVIYGEGTRHVASGTATCAGEEHAVELSYWAPGDGAVVLACANPARDAVAVHVKRAYCPGELSAEERAVIGLDPSDAASVRTVEDVAGSLRLPWTR